MGRGYPEYLQEGCSTALLASDTADRGAPRGEVMTAAEAMYFKGAPLAHVVQYEELRWTRRIEAVFSRRPAPRL